MKNYLPDVMRPVKEMEIIKAILVNIKGNLKKQTDNWRNNWEFIVNMDSQKLLPQKRGYRFILKQDNKSRIDLKHLAHYTLSWIACIDDYCNLHHTPKAKHSKYPRRMNWDDSEKKFQNIQKMHGWHPIEVQYSGQLTVALGGFITEECLNG